MAANNTNAQYGSVTKVFHWLTALFILTLIPVGLIANRMPYETSEQLASKAWMFSLHKTLGVCVFFVALLRILWALRQPKPAGLHPERKVESWAAETVHWLLYGSLVLAPLSGWVHHASTAGFAPIWWPLGQNLPLVPKSEVLAGVTWGLHHVFVKVLGVAVLLHIAGALKHHVIDRDATLARMLPGSPDVDAAPQSHTHTPLISALVIWVAALGIGAGMGAYGSHSGGVPAAQLEAVASEWEVQDGTVAITVQQLGSSVEGQFADWTAAITFDANELDGPAGNVTATISVGSLTLGSVTDQALGPDFLDAEGFATAVYEAEIFASPDGYRADGTLTIKDNSVPVTLPFDLSIKNGVATMSGEVSLDRRDFGVGDTMPDESSLGFGVAVSIALTATKTP